MLFTHTAKLIIIFIIQVFIFPSNNNYGLKFNNEREKLGIPKLEIDWKKDDIKSKNRKIYWANPDLKNGHYKKVIEYGVLNAKYETNYYKSDKNKGRLVWSKYDFDNNTIKYFTSKKTEYETEMIQEIDKSEFEKHSMD